jgi:hypothetical protein
VPPDIVRYAVRELICEKHFLFTQDREYCHIGVRWWYGMIRWCRVREEHLRFDMRLKLESSFQKGVVDPTAALRSSLSVRSEMHCFRLNQHFPKRVREVQIEMNDATKDPTIVVHFVNGHSVRRRESEVMSSEFLALCGMLYDLPPKGDR